MARKRFPANIVGKEIQKQRNKLGLTQEDFAAKCQLVGLDISRSTLGQIESQIRFVHDFELFLLATALEIPVGNLFPEDTKKARPHKNK